MKVAIQVCSYDEPGLADTLDAWAAQPLPDGWSAMYHAGVTPEPGYTGPRTFGMVDHARSHPVFEYVETPSGKLSARNVLHDLAVDRGADVIISTDADAPPWDETTTETLLAAFDDPRVVAANTTPVSPPTPLGLVVNLLAPIEDFVLPHMNGQGHALTTDAWRAVGPFDESVSQTDSRLIRQEEEFGFYRRLRDYGTVVRTNARVYNETRRAECRFGLRNDWYCQRLRDDPTTFHPYSSPKR